MINKIIMDILFLLNYLTVFRTSMYLRIPINFGSLSSGEEIV